MRYLSGGLIQWRGENRVTSHKSTHDCVQLFTIIGTDISLQNIPTYSTWPWLTRWHWTMNLIHMIRMPDRQQRGMLLTIGGVTNNEMRWLLYAVVVPCRLGTGRCHHTVAVAFRRCGATARWQSQWRYSGWSSGEPNWSSGCCCGIPAQNTQKPDYCGQNQNIFLAATDQKFNFIQSSGRRGKQIYIFN